MRRPSRGHVLRWYQCKPGLWQQEGVIFGLTLLTGLGVLVSWIFTATPGDYGGLVAGVAIAAIGGLMLTLALRAGIGVADEGVLVRSIFGWPRWAYWSEVKQFDLVRPRHWRGNAYAICVVLTDRRPLIVDGCKYEPWSKWTDSNWKILLDLRNALEDERIAAQRPLNDAGDKDP